MKSRPLIVLLIFFVFIFSCKKEKVLTWSQLSNNLKDIKNEDLNNLRDEILNNYQSYTDFKKFSEKHNHRMSGSENGRAAEEYIFNKLIEYGVEASYLEFKFDLWLRKFAQVDIYATDEYLNFNSVSFAYTPESTDVQGLVIDLNEGLVADFLEKRQSINGNIMLINLKNSRTKKKKRQENSKPAPQFKVENGKKKWRHRSNIRHYL